MPVYLVIAVVLAALVVAMLNVASVRLRIQMIGKLNAHNPPERQYDSWGWQIATKRFNLFTRPYFWWEYRRVFGFDSLLMRTVILMVSSGFIGLLLALSLARMALTRG